MFRNKLYLIVALLVALQFFANAQSAHAYAYETSHDKTCSSFSITGTSNAAYVTVSIYNGTQLFLDIFPVTNGAFSINVSYPQQPEGSTVIYNVWGNLSATDPWSTDGEFYISIDEPCSVAPVPPYVSISSAQMYCNAFSVNAWSNAPYFGVQVETSNGQILYRGKFASNTNSYRSVLANFTTQRSGTYLRYRIWPSSTADVTSYDGSSGSASSTLRCSK